MDNDIECRTTHPDPSLSDYVESFWMRPENDRGPLRNILLESLQPDTVVWNSQFVSMTQIDNSWKLEFKNGSYAYADIVIAADVVEGAVYNAETASPKIHQLLKGGKIFAFGDEKSLIVSSKGDGSFAFYTGCKNDEHWVNDSGVDFNNKAQVITWFQNEFAVAMLDALELSVCLTSNEFSDMQSAIAHYEKQMCKRAAEAAKTTLDSTEMLHSADPITNLIEMFGDFGVTGK